MSRSNRLFEIIQLLRGADKPLTAAKLAVSLEVAPRTIYRDIAALQAMRVPVAGEAGIGYVMRAGFDLPPLMFTEEEIEALIVGLALLGRTGDAGLQAAASSVAGKIAQVMPERPGRRLKSGGLYVSRWGAASPGATDLSRIRRAIRDERKLSVVYENDAAARTERTIKPLGLVYYIEVVVLAAWCELRRDYRHFRVDRIASCAETAEDFIDEGEALRAIWRRQQRPL